MRLSAGTKIASCLAVLCGSARAANHEVMVLDFFYSPGLVTIDVGDTVTWVNASRSLHTVSSGSDFTPDGQFDAGLLVPGQMSRPVAFDTAGEYPYFCQVHTQFMGTGIIMVGGSQNVDIVSANPPLDNPFVAGDQPFRDVLQTGSSPALTQGIGKDGTPVEDSIVYGTISVTFSGPPTPAPEAGNIAVNCVGGSTPCPTVLEVAGSGPDTYVLTMTGAIPPGGCTTLTFAGTNAGQKLQYQSLPGDLNLGGTVAVSDALTLVSAINSGAAANPANLARYDVNRNSSVSATDVVRLIGLLNGLNTTQAWLGAAVAACP